ncbi:MAG: Gfo/Idh/MocA family oxidoreductase [Minisyncoccia bacterium]
MARLPVATKQKKPTYRVAVVGCGKIGALFEAEPKREKPASHAGAAVLNSRTKLAAFVDTRKENLAAAAKLFPQAVPYAKLSFCLKKERPDIVVIATPPAARLALIRECVREGVRIVVCEKPLASNKKEAAQIEALVKKSRTTFVLNYQRRFSPLFARVRQEIKKGKLGRIQQITCYYSNGLYSNAGHIVDALSYVLDDEIVSASGFTNAVNKTHPAGDINVDAILKTKKGTTIALQSFDQKEYGIHDIRIYGTKESATLTDYGMTLVETPAAVSQFKGVLQLDGKRRRETHSPLSATKQVLTHAIESYEKKLPQASSATSGLAVLRVLDAIARSAKLQGKTIRI